jgi:Sodium:neurotransmitter symporter family
MGFAHGAGSYVFVLFDNFSGNFPLLIIAFFECIAVSYVYGLRRSVLHHQKHLKDEDSDCVCACF